MINTNVACPEAHRSTLLEEVLRLQGQDLYSSVTLGKIYLVAVLYLGNKYKGKVLKLRSKSKKGRKNLLTSNAMCLHS